MSDTIYTGSKRLAAAMVGITNDSIGTPSTATTGSPPFPRPTKMAAKTARNQNKRSYCIYRFRTLLGCTSILLFKTNRTHAYTQ